MRKVFLCLLFLALFVLVYPRLALAAPYPDKVGTDSIGESREFSSSYNVSYDIDSSGEASVTENITLINQTDRYYASQFSLTIGASEISEVSATDSSGSLETKVEKQTAPVGSILQNKQIITVKFAQQIAGKGKEYKWTLKFRSRDFAQKSGKVWQVSIPRVVETPDLVDYKLMLSLPVSFGDPATIIPQPAAESEVGGKLQFQFTKDQLLKSGILANFGTNQIFQLRLKYKLDNPSVLPIIAKIALPPDSAYQKVSIGDITPKPENIISDSDGNYVALFKLNKLESFNVEVTATVKLSLASLDNYKTLTGSQSQNLTSSQRYWESDNPILKGKLADIVKDGVPESNQEKARLINKYVVNTLIFNAGRLNDPQERLGSLTALSSPESSLAYEFTDLFVALARSAKIPTRELIGYAYTANNQLRPQSINRSIHVWPEYFDPKLGWVMIDPTWENTTGGVDYFSKFDLNHVVIAIRGASSLEPAIPTEISSDFSDNDFQDSPNIFAKISIPDEIYGQIPSQAVITLTNKSAVVFPASLLRLKASKIKLVLNKFTAQTVNELSVPAIPPWGHLEIKFDLRSDSLLETYQDKISLEIADRSFEKQIRVRPFFNARFFPIIVLGLMITMVGIYLAVVVLYLSNNRQQLKAALKLPRPNLKKKKLKSS